MTITPDTPPPPSNNLNLMHLRNLTSLTIYKGQSMVSLACCMAARCTSSTQAKLTHDYLINLPKNNSGN